MSFQALENQMKGIISTLKPGTEFMLRDIINDPPAGLGKKLFEGVQNGEIENVICIEQGKGADKYRKL